MLSKLITRFKSNNISLCFSGFKEHVLDVIERTGLSDSIGKDNLFSSDRSAARELQYRLEMAS